MRTSIASGYGPICNVPAGESDRLPSGLARLRSMARRMTARPMARHGMVAIVLALGLLPVTAPDARAQASPGVREAA